MHWQGDRPVQGGGQVHDQPEGVGAGYGGAQVDTGTPRRGSQVGQVRLVLDKDEQPLLYRFLIGMIFLIILTLS